jgi:uncharacterized delta-60 repeat protein
MDVKANNAGTVDTSFADKGMFTLDLATYQETTILGLLADPTDRTIYFTGKAHNGGSDRPYVLGRLLEDGGLDDAFGNSGIVTGEFGISVDSRGESIALLAQGNILLIGATHSSPAMARFLPNGVLDKSYGVNGHLVLENPSTPANEVPEGRSNEPVSVHSNTSSTRNGQILISFTYRQSDAPISSYVFMLNNNGDPELSFNGKGYVEVIHPDHPPDNIVLHGALIDENGNAVACGLLKSGTTTAPLFVRYKRNGSLDPSFGDNGFVVTETTAEYSTVVGAIRQVNKRVLGLGYANDGAQYSGLLESLEPDGKPNIQFNGGKALLIRLDNADTYWTGARQQPNGRIVLVGDYWPKGESTIAVARLQSDGSFDQSFNDGQGWTTTPIGQNGPSARAIELQGDGKILICAAAALPQTSGVILRYHV